MNDFSDLQKKIEQRQSEIMKALEEENRVWKLMEKQLKRDIEQSFKNALSLSIDNMEKQEKRLIARMQRSLEKIESKQEKLAAQVIKARYYEWLKPLGLGAVFIMGTLVFSWAFNLYWSKEIESYKKQKEQLELTDKELRRIEGYKGIKEVYRNGILLKKGYGATLNNHFLKIVKEK